MELLIPGLILVALMVWASTRIKKNVAAAFEAETVETDEYTIRKPDGWLNVLGGDPKYIFEAYTKEFGARSAANTRQGTAYISVIPERSANAAIAEIADVEEIVSNVSEVVGDHHYKVIEARRTQDGSDFRTFYKMAETSRGLLKLEIKVLADAPEELIAGADMMAASFELK